MLKKLLLSFILVTTTMASDVINLENGAFEEILKEYDIGLVQFMAR